MNAHSAISATLKTSDIRLLQSAAHGDPFGILGPHEVDGHFVVRAYYPGAKGLRLEIEGREPIPCAQVEDGFYEGILPVLRPYRLIVDWPSATVVTPDPYAAPLAISDYDLHLMREGRLLELALTLGANRRTINGVDGFLFAVWAPNAANVSVVGDFNSWDARRHPMRLRHDAGVWELFLPGIKAGDIYKFAIRGRDGKMTFKADPLAKMAELPPATGSIVTDPLKFDWHDQDWLQSRPDHQRIDAPISAYEVHVGAWLRTHDDHFGTWEEAADRLIPHVSQLGFTHVELMPIAAYPFGGSWGYQPLSLFAPTPRYGSPDGLAHFVDRCHQAGIGVIIDWVPAHFPNDEHGLIHFDGSALYEHADPREGYHPDWNTMIYNVGRSEVRGFLIASALWWLNTYHIDGLRVDAVASMLYRDYSRKDGEWVPNIYGGRENLESVAFLKELNAVVHARVPGALMIAEESTAWPGVTAPDGLGFDLKWNMGWMHDTLHFFEHDPIHRSYHLNNISFGLVYAFSEGFMLSLSHDEVVHGKRSLIGRMPGDDWQRFANMRLLFSTMWTHPGKKLIFMGGEFGMEAEFDADAPFPWPHPYDEKRQGLMRLVGDLNRLYRERPQLYRLDRVSEGFRWIVGEDRENSIFAWRRSDGDPVNDLIIAFNTTPIPRHDYRIGVPHGGRYAEIFNSDAGIYGGANLGNGSGLRALNEERHGEPWSLSLTIPPLGLVILEPRWD